MPSSPARASVPGRKSRSTYPAEVIRRTRRDPFLAPTNDYCGPPFKCGDPPITSRRQTCCHSTMTAPSRSLTSTDPERTLEFEFVRATENAALNVIDWLGRGEKELADA